MNDTTKNQNLDDFGEVIQGAKKHNFADLDLTNADTRKLPFSKLWAKSEIDAIEDVTVAAIAHHVRNSMPTKPRKPLAQKNWFTKLENAQTTVAWLVARPEAAKTLIEKLEAGGWNDRVSAFAIQMMAQTDRKHWDKLAFDIRGNSFLVRAGEENHKYSVADVSTANIAEVVAAMKPAVDASLDNYHEQAPKQKAVQFLLYRNNATNEIFVAAKPDKEKTPLMYFDSPKEARDYLYNEDEDIRRENLENLNHLWQEHKELNNIVKADMRSSENTARIGAGYRDGRDISPEEFMQTFNIRGGQFGNWVKGDERQTHLNHAYDAFMDLSKAANIPPSAIGLNGELGIAFGARGSGWAAAHYETAQKVINLTKTKGAGSLAHEWWHALDHYLGGKDLATRDISSIRPENMRHAELSTPLQTLLQATRNTELYKRSFKADGSRSKAYFSTDVEMTARAFERYVANQLEGHAIRNDYLVNIIKFDDWQRNSDAYVYPKDDELEAFSQAYDHVFDKLAEVDKSFQREAKALTAEQLQELQSNLERINDYEPDNNQFAAYAYVQSTHIAKLPSDRQLAASEQALEWIHEVYRGSFSFKDMINALPDKELAAQIGVYANTPKEDWRYIDKVAVEMDVIEVHITNGEVRRQIFSTNLANATEWVAENSRTYIEQAKVADRVAEAEKTAQAPEPPTPSSEPTVFQAKQPIFNGWTLNDVLQFKGNEMFDNHIKDGALKLPLETVLAHEINNDANNSKLFMDYFRDLRSSTRDWNSPLRQTEMFIQNDAHFDERENRINQVQASFDAIVQRYGNQVIDQAAVFSVDENRVLLSDSITGTAAFGALELQNDLRYERALLAEDRGLANYYRQIPLNPADAAKPLTRDASNQQYNDLFRQRVGLSRFDHDYQQKFESYVQNAKLFIERPVASQAAFGNRISVVENLRSEILTYFEIVKKRMAEAEKQVEATSEVEQAAAQAAEAAADKTPAATDFDFQKEMEARAFLYSMKNEFIKANWSIQPAENEYRIVVTDAIKTPNNQKQFTIDKDPRKLVNFIDMIEKGIPDPDIGETEFTLRMRIENAFDDELDAKHNSLHQQILDARRNGDVEAAQAAERERRVLRSITFSAADTIEAIDLLDPNSINVIKELGFPKTAQVLQEIQATVDIASAINANHVMQTGEAEKVAITSEVAEPAPAEQAQDIVQTQDKASAIRAMADEYMIANGFTVENGNYKYISANGDDRKVVDFDGLYYSVHDKLPDNFTMSDFHSAMMKVGWYEIHDFKNPTAKTAEQVTEAMQTADQVSEFGQSADMDAPSENEKELPPQHPVEIPADDKGSKLGSSKSDEYLQKIADRILEQVKNNEAPWQKPFEAGTIHNVLPVSGASGKTYQGLNLINLMATAAAKGYDDNRWYTYNNAQEAGGQVRRGEKGTQIHFWHIPTKEDVEKEQTNAAAEGREPKNLSPKLRIYTVFNAEQIDGLPERQLNETLLTKFERHEKAESILENSGVRIEHTPEKTGYYSAHYNPRTDTITLPQRELFASEDAYYATALHELAHATGHESRLNRDLSGAFGSYSYAKEELRAEMASMMIGQELQIGHDPTNHYAYLQSWAAVIENDPKEFFKAAKDADLITNYVLNLDRTKEKVAEVEQAAEQTTEAVKQPTSSYNASIPHSVQTVAKLDKPLEDKVLMLAEKSAIADKIQSVDSEQLKSFVRGIKSAMDFNEHNHKQLLDLATYGNNAFDAREFALHTGMVGDQGVDAYDKALQDLADAGILKSVDDGWKYKLTDEAAYLIKQTYNVVEAEKVTQQEISSPIAKSEPMSEFGQLVDSTKFAAMEYMLRNNRHFNEMAEQAKHQLLADITNNQSQPLTVFGVNTLSQVHPDAWDKIKITQEDDKTFMVVAESSDFVLNHHQTYTIEDRKDLTNIAEVAAKSLRESLAYYDDKYIQHQPSDIQHTIENQHISAENRRLFVPYEQKDVASALGARWDKDNKTWYAPAGSDLDKFKPWLKEPVREFISPEDEFAKQLEAHGLRLETGHPIMDGQWHRLKVDGDRTGKSGAYIGHLDGVPRGTVKNFKTGQETNWTAKDAVVKSVPSSLDIERAKAAAEAKQKASYNQAADAARLVLNHAQPAQNHPYLDKKGVAAHGVYIIPDKSAVNLDNTSLAIANDWREAKAMRENFKANGIEKQVLTKGDLIVPAINEHGDLRTFQTISGNDGSFKSFVKGGEKSGSFHVIGDLNNAKDVMIAEGYATAATLHEQTGKPVVVAFDAGNLSPVAEKVRTSLPDARIYIAADNDRNNAVNTGIEKANAAAEKVDAKVIVPQFDKLDGADKLSDWNDLHKANAHDFVAQLATSDMGRQDFTDKLANLPPERQEVFKGWYDYINEKLANHPESRNTKQASLEQEVKKAEQGLSNLPSVADYQAQQAVKKQAAQVVTQQPTQQATVAIQAPAVDTTAGKGKGGFDR